MTESAAPRRRNRRPKFDDATIANLKRGAKAERKPDPQCPPNHYFRIPAAGSNAPVSFLCIERNPLGKQIWHTFGNANTMTVEQARATCKAIAKKIKAGEPLEAPKPVKPDSVAEVCANWLKRYVVPRKHKTEADTRRIIDVYITPHIGDRAFTDLRKSDTAALGDIIEDNHGPRMADRVLGILRQVCMWFSERAPDNYIIPFIPRGGIKRDHAGARKRVLTDDEIRAIWLACGDGIDASFGAFCRFALLTGQRKGAILAMQWDDVDAKTGLWTVRDPGERSKGDIGKVRLSKLALGIIANQTRVLNNDRVFASMKGRAGLSNFTRCKPRLDERSKVRGWRIHDLRRTARTLMSRAGIDKDTGERVLGHAIPGSRGIYDRFEYTEAKTAALDKLANMVAEIIGLPHDAKVVKLKGRRRSQG